MSDGNVYDERDVEAFEERAAIMEHDGGLAPDEAEEAARISLARKPHDDGPLVQRESQPFAAMQPLQVSNAMTTTKKINLATIRIDGGTQARVGHNEATVAQYATELEEEGFDFPPIIVFYDGTDNWMADGFHRFLAYTRRGRASIPADVRAGSLRDAVLYALSANSKHGLPRTNEDKRKAVSIVLDDNEWSKQSLRDIAKLCGVSYQLVSNIMQERDAPPPARTEPPPEVGAVNIDKLKLPETGGNSAELPPKVEGPSTSPSPGLTAQEKADVIAADAHGDVTVSQLLDETQAELDAAIRKIAALEADDKVKELSKWQTAADVHSRRADEHLAKVNLSDKELKRMGSILKKIGEIVGEDDYAKLPATVKVFVDVSVSVAA